MLQAGKDDEQRFAAGFTLLELLIVITLVAITASMVTVSMRTGSGSSDLKSAVMNIASRMREARSVAIHRSADAVVLLDLKRRTMRFGRQRTADSFDPSINLHVTSASSEQVTPSLAGIRFFPNGGSTGGTIRLERKGKIYEVRVNWLTGRVVTKRLN